MSYESINKALEREIEIIENDDCLSGREKHKAISEVEKEARDYHIIYTDKSGKVQSLFRDFASFLECEIWLGSIGATYWEIGI